MYTCTILQTISLLSHSYRYAITQAARSCNVTIVDRLLQVGREAFLSKISDFCEFTHDLHSGLCSLANSGCIETVERVIKELDLLPNSVYLWQSNRSLYLLYLLIESKSCNSLELVNALAFDLASFLFKSMLQSNLHVTEGSPLYNVQHATKLMKRIDSFSHVFGRCDSSNVQLLSKLARYYNRLRKTFVFHYLCSLGEFELVSHFLTCLDSCYHASLFRSLDDDQKSPLYYAACGGHLDIVQLLLDKGCETYCPNENPPIKGALIYLACCTYSTTLDYRKCPGSKLSRSTFRKGLGTIQSAVSMEEPWLVNMLLPSTEDLEHILSNKDHASDIFFLIAFQQNLHICHRLLLRILEVLEKESASFLTLSHHFLDDAVNLVPYHCVRSDEGFILLDSILAKLSTLMAPYYNALVTAAHKGLWSLVKQALPHSIVEYPDNCDRCKFSLCTMLSSLIHAGARQRRFDVVASVYNICLSGKEVPHSCYRPLLQAFQHNQVEVSAFIESKHGLEFLLEAVKLNDASVVEAVFNFLISTDASAVEDFDLLISHCHSTTCLVVLHKYFMDPSVPIEIEIEDRHQEFWCTVLLFQTSKGNTQLAFKAVASLADAQLQDFSQQPEFRAVLGNCCYWGMKDILGCLPFEQSQLLEPCSYSEPLSPWEIAVANGHVGKLSEVDNFPSMSQALKSIPCDSQLHICVLDNDHSSDENLASHIACVAPLFFHRVGHKLLSLPVDSSESTTVSESFLPFRDEFVTSFVDLFEYAIRVGKFYFVKTSLDHLGSYASELLDEMFSFVNHACDGMDNLDVLEVLLRCLHDADRLNKHHDTSLGKTLLSLVVRRGSVSYAKVLVRWLPHDALDDRLHRRYQQEALSQSNTLLHLAVLSRSTEMVDYILELLGQDAPRFCFNKNSNGHSPLSLAFALGLTNIICFSGLVTEASKLVTEFSSTWASLETECGWFPLLMQLNTQAISADSANAESTETTLTVPCTPVCDFRFKLACIVRLLMNAVSDGRVAVVLRLMLLVGKFELTQQVYLDSEILHILFVGGYLSDVSLNLPQTSLLNVISRCGREDLLLNLLKVDCILRAGLLKQTFLYSCELNKSSVVHYLLQERDTHLLFEDESILKEGLAHAVACGSFETASLILLECGVHLEHKYLPPGVKLSEVVELIFTCSSYHQLLKRFYSSLVELKCDRTSLSVAWLAHGWTKKEAEFIMRNLGGSNPSNPWTIDLQSKKGSQQVSLSIDWESVSECLLHSPRLEQEISKFRHIPLLVEAIIFSPSILGQICQASSTFQSFDIFSFSKAAGLSSLILSSVLWPQKPSFSSLFEGQGILTLSFMPMEGVFLFPTPTSTSSFDLNDSTVSFTSDDSAYLSVTVASHHLTDQLSDLAHFTVAIFKKKISKKLQVSISFSDEVMDISDVNLFTQTYESARVILCDTVEVLSLVRNPSVVLSFFNRGSGVQHKSVPCLSGFRLPFSKVQVLLDLPDKYTSYSMQTDPLIVSITDDTLNIHFVLPREIESIGPGSTCSGFHNQLLETLIPHIIVAQTQSARERLERSIETVVMTNLKNHLKLSGFLGSELISVIYEDYAGQKLKLCDVDAKQNIFTSLFMELKRFLFLFSTMLHALSYQPRLQTNARRTFEAGFKVILTEKHDTSFTLKGGVPCMMVSAQRLLEGMPRKVLVDVFGSLVNSVQGQKRFMLEGNIPSPIMCYIDFENSCGLLYPVLNKTGTITVQLVNHNLEIISSLPTVNCVLNVCITMPGGSQITATSSHDPSPRAASRHLMANAKPNGQFVVEWTPVKVGVHYVSIHINDTPVGGSPFKTHTLSSTDTYLRQASAGESITFVVSHNLSFNLSLRKHGCLGSVPPIVLYKRRSIKELIAVAMSGGEPSTPLSPSRNLSPSKSSQSLSAKGCSAIHHISMCSRYGGPRQWFHIPVGDVVVYISPHAGLQRQLSQGKVKRKLSRKNFTVKHYAMNNGLTRIVITCTFATVYKMFVACSKCQSVMYVLWPDQRTLLPSLLYVTPTSFSGQYSELVGIWPSTTSNGELES